ncbi:MAG: outer membrane lipoprotein chaperone LolA, partial [Epsilonproteobacteria bacterium]|nr:outer membrane lipoprotein chaperone LolA [Campylobacterota bacterium]
PHILWIYTKPIQKRIYIDRSKIVIIEPDLEQVIIKQLRQKDLFSLLKKAKKEDDHYVVRQKEREFLIYLDHGTIKKVIYKDRLDNTNVVKFLDPKQNLPLDEKIFEPKIDPEYDIIHE